MKRRGNWLFIVQLIILAVLFFLSSCSTPIEYGDYTYTVAVEYKNGDKDTLKFGFEPEFKYYEGYIYAKDSVDDKFFGVAAVRKAIVISKVKRKYSATLKNKQKIE